MKQPIRIDHVVKHFEGYLVEDTFGEKFYVYKGDWGNSRTTYRWWIDQAHFAFEDENTWSRIHCEDTREACFRQIQEWEDLKVKKAQSHVEQGWQEWKKTKPKVKSFPDLTRSG